ncbi:hypothetical protein [Sphingobacterium luzhongxinii]|uniref:hypothetical protein n=1 Tax=Sphingobacterium luzhongxinii TaxID=2654181 RepID=UPI0013DA675F|nr:hypothetical protein [Sphingobacterium sp. xlx-73]
MKTKILYFLLLTVCFGCKVNKEKSERLQEGRQMQSRLESTTSWTQFHSQDSSLRYWYYRGDSTFFFHPDIGLWSRAGELRYGEQRAVRTQLDEGVQRYDSLTAERSSKQREARFRKYSDLLSHWRWLLLGIPLLLGIYWYWPKK